VAVTVFGCSSNLFSSLIAEIYNAMEGHWFDHTRTSLPLTKEEFRTYCFMAARTRIARVNNERRDVWPLRTNENSGWTLPSQVASVINSVGRVFMDETATELVPVWPATPTNGLIDPDLDTPTLKALVIDELFFERIGMQLKRVHSFFKTLQGVPVVFVDNIAGEVDGDPDVMCLVPAYALPTSADAGEAPVRLHARAASDRMVNGTVAFNYLAWALMPAVYMTNHVGLHPLESPGGRYIETAAVNATWIRLLAKASA